MNEAMRRILGIAGAVSLGASLTNSFVDFGCATGGILLIMAAMDR